MIERSALPAIVCHDCGHVPRAHRPNAETGGSCSLGTCPCARTAIVVEHAGEVAIAATRAERKRLGYAVLLSTLAAVLAGAGSLGVSAWNTRQSEKRDCETLRADIEAIEAGGQLTPAGDRVTQSRRARYQQINCVPPLPAAGYKIVRPR